jgi:hypothetical protein
MIPFLSLTPNLAQEILQSIAQHNNVRETHLMILERFSWLDWKNQYHSVIEFSSLVNIIKIGKILYFISKETNSYNIIKYYSFVFTYDS